MTQSSIWKDLRIASTLMSQFTLRHWLSALWSYGLILMIVAVGVASLNGIRQANRAATTNFALFNEAVSGRSDFWLQAPAGPIQADQLFDLDALSHSSDWHLFPVIEGPLRQLGKTGAPAQQLRLVGLDLVSLGNLPHFVEQGFRIGGGEESWYESVKTSEKIWISSALLTSNKLRLGDHLQAAVAGTIYSLEIAGTLGDVQHPVPEDLVIADLLTAQSILGRSEEIDRVEVIINDRARARDTTELALIEQQLAAQLPAGLLLKPAAERIAERTAMTQAFSMNLTVLSLIAILVGAYLILQALDAAVVRRRGELATLKSLGTSGRAIVFCLLLEAVFIGLLGSTLGIGMGLLLASGAVHLIAETVDTLYFATAVASIQLEASDLLIGYIAGISLSVLASWLPARDAIQTPPAQILSRGDWSPGFKWLHQKWTGIVLLLLGALALAIPAPILEGGGRFPIGGFLAAGCWIVGAAVLSGELMITLYKRLRVFRMGPVGLLASSRLAEGSSRHRLAVAGLVVAVSMVTGILQMVGSFKGTIEQWFDVRFQADIYISEKGSTGVSSLNGIKPEIIRSLLNKDSVDYTDTLYSINVTAPRGQTTLTGVDFDLWRTQIKQIWQVRPGEMRPVNGAQPAFVSEAFARRFDVLDGGVVTLETPSGHQQITPVGIYSDYGNEFGTAAIDQKVWYQWTGIDRAINTSLFLKPGTDVNVFRDALRLEYPGLDIRNAQELRTVVLNIFYQTFQVTFALNAIGIFVAMAGLVLGLLALFAESSDTWKILSHLGFDARKFMQMAGVESAGIALSAWLNGTVTGLALGWLLIYVINVQSFGWTLIWELPIASFLLFGVALTACAYLCGLITGAWWWNRYR